jgi:hypothetical protein
MNASRYTSAMPSRPDLDRARLSEDTARTIEDWQVEAWRRMTSVEIAQTLNAAWTAGMQLAWFGLKDRFPSASDNELRVRLAVLILGRDLASRLYPDAVAWL